jgi:hypothetical protein
MKFVATSRVPRWPSSISAGPPDQAANPNVMYELGIRHAFDLALVWTTG